jgi:SAM-dependent methyltransferase
MAQTAFLGPGEARTAAGRPGPPRRPLAAAGRRETTATACDDAPVAEPIFDAANLFDEDYLYFYAVRDPDGTRSDAETDLIWRLLDLRPGAEVLDLACGHGRIANRLAARGCRVTGLDSSAVFLDKARAEAAAAGVPVNYVHGDMRNPPAGPFDRVVNWYTAFGYFDDDGNREVLAALARVTRPGGLAAVELNNYAAVMRTYQPASVFEPDGDLLVDRHRFDPLTGRNLVERTIVRGGTVRRVPYFVRMFTYPELRDWLLAAGFTEVAGYGEDGEPLNAEHRRMIVVARC